MKNASFYFCGTLFLAAALLSVHFVFHWLQEKKIQEVDRYAHAAVCRSICSSEGFNFTAGCLAQSEADLETKKSHGRAVYLPFCVYQ